MKISAQNNRGQWVPAIPEPFFLNFGRVRCDCGSTFWGRERYRAHYAYAHILDLAPEPASPTRGEP
jgi:hypothetical protein